MAAVTYAITCRLCGLLLGESQEQFSIICPSCVRLRALIKRKAGCDVDIWLQDHNFGGGGWEWMNSVFQACRDVETLADEL